jgi:hypothetical protein
MSSKKSQILNLWENSYKQNVQNKFITYFEAVNMISNETSLDLKATEQILKSSFIFIENIHNENHHKRHC